MIIKEISAEKVLDSRKVATISVFIKTEQGTFSTASPSGTSTGKYEKPSFIESIEHDIQFLKNIKLEFNFLSFSDLKKVEELVKNKIGANSLYALEASLLKAAAYEKNMPLWKFLNPKANRFQIPVCNIIGGGNAQPRKQKGKRQIFRNS